MEDTIDLTRIPCESSFMDQGLQAQLSGIFGKMEGSVTMKAMADLNRDRDQEMVALLKTISVLSQKLDLELYGSEEASMVPELDTAWLPVTGLYKDNIYGRAALHGVSGDKEINSFVLTIHDLAGPGQAIPGRLRKKIDKLAQKTNIKMRVSLACHHCPVVVTVCQHIAILNPNIGAKMIGAVLYEGLVARYDIKRISMIIINDTEIYAGSKETAKVVALLKK